MASELRHFLAATAGAAWLLVAPAHAGDAAAAATVIRFAAAEPAAETAVADPQATEPEAADATATGPAPEAKPSESAPVWNSRSHRPRRVGTDAELRRLTAELQLDANQQQQVRRILEEQHQRTLKAWSTDASPSASQMKATQAIAAQTADRIRAVLTDEQRKKYPQARVASATSVRPAKATQ
jgi:hypothetical protein